VPRAFKTFPTLGEFHNQLVANSVSLFGTNQVQFLTFDGRLDLIESWINTSGFIESINEQIIASNQGETNLQNLFALATNSQLLVELANDQVALLDNIAANIFLLVEQGVGGGATIDLSTVEFNLEAILRDTSSIAQSVGGGAPLGFGDIVAALQQGFQDIGFAIGDNQIVTMTSTGRLVSAIGIDNGPSLGQTVESGLTKIDAALKQLGQLLLASSGNIDPATQKIADNTKDSAQLDVGVALAAALAGKAPLEDYMEFLQHSDIGFVGDAAWSFVKTMLSALAPPPLRPQVEEGIQHFIDTGAQKGLTAAITDSVHYISAQGPDVVGNIIGKIFGSLNHVAEFFEPALAAVFKPAFDLMLGGIKESVAAAGEVGPAGGFKAAEQFLSKAALNGMHAHHLAELLEMIPWTKHFGMNMLPAFMADMAGFGQIASQTWGRAVGEGVGRAAGYEINASMRSRLPDPRMLEQMVFEGQLSEGDQAALLAFSGYNDDWIARMQTIQYAEPNLRQLSSLAADASMPEGQTETWLREIGFSVKDAAALLPIIMQQSMKAERGSLSTEVMANLRAGLLDEADAEIYFDKLRLHPLARDMLFTAARLGLRRNSIEDNINTYKQLYNDGLLDDSDFRLGVQAQGVTQARLEVELAQVASKRFAKIADTEEAETKAEVRKQQGLLISAMREAFQHGMIDSSQFQQALTHAGITQSTAAATVELERIKLEGRAQTSRSAEAARILQREQRLREDTFVELFRKGAINNLQLQQFLLGSGLPEAVVNAIVDRELARARPSPGDLFKSPGALKAKELFTLAAAKLQVDFAKAAIDADQYLTQLVALGSDVDIARATVALAVARRGAEKQPPAPATKTTAELAALKKQVDDALEKFAQTDQTPAALEDVLARLGIVEEVLDALIALANEGNPRAAD
jgi:hypothetical protein